MIFALNLIIALYLSIVLYIAFLYITIDVLKKNVGLIVPSSLKSL